MAIQIRRNAPPDAVQGRSDSPDASRGTSGARGRSKRLSASGAVLQSLKQMTGWSRSSSLKPQRPPFASLPPASSTVQEDLVGDTVKWINRSAAARPQGTPKLTREQALAAGKPVPTRAPPPPPRAGNAASSMPLDDDDDLMELHTVSGKVITAPRPERAGNAASPIHLELTREQALAAGKPVPTRAPPPPPRAGNAASSIHLDDDDDLMELNTASGKVAPAPRSAVTQTPPGSARGAARRQPVHGPLGPRRARSSWKPDLATIHEEKHSSGPLSSLGAHYDGIMRQLRSANTQAQNALTQPRIPLFASTKKKRAILEGKRGELQQHAAALGRLLNESGSAAVDEKTVRQLGRETHPEIPVSQLRAVDRDIAETLRQRRHVQKTLETVHKWIAEIDKTLA
ncbi:hypothetical protein [Paraburkholderia terricola]|uniref:Uncharacterized protein n=1 Tax=Paraburkholderia terricola TaxID=169427 RepID=A0A1M6VEF5_9BURK|nr:MULTISPECIES: hypothetical protein [Paraburkholderia]ORC49572.1 hypothetical protein B2G74_16465 [Burkholderia sp. A27]SDP02802.1 hypothetical protein SAMN05192547_103762 [Paraburkholderia sediminicola]SHK79666.1 hypothetical protein SAMN05192548_103862 [Paraburkholderia terricola]